MYTPVASIIRFFVAGVVLLGVGFWCGYSAFYFVFALIFIAFFPVVEGLFLKNKGKLAQIVFQCFFVSPEREAQHEEGYFFYKNSPAYAAFKRESARYVILFLFCLVVSILFGLRDFPEVAHLEIKQTQLDFVVRFLNIAAVPLIAICTGYILNARFHLMGAVRQRIAQDDFSYYVISELIEALMPCYFSSTLSKKYPCLNLEVQFILDETCSVDKCTFGAEKPTFCRIRKLVNDDRRIVHQKIAKVISILATSHPAAAQVINDQTAAYERMIRLNVYEVSVSNNIQEIPLYLCKMFHKDQDFVQLIIQTVDRYFQQKTWLNGLLDDDENRKAIMPLFAAMLKYTKISNSSDR